MAVFMLETLKLTKTLKSSRDDFNVLDNSNISSIKMTNVSIGWKSLRKEGKITNHQVNIPLIGDTTFSNAGKYEILP